jgi:sugar phosphate isomerase/epimerase
MQIKYVISTMIFWWRENHLSFELECDYLKSLSFGIELWPTMKGNNDCRYEKRRWNRLKEATGGMLVSLKSRKDGPTLNEWNEQIQCAKMLNAPIVADLQSLCISDQLGIADWAFASDVVKKAEDNNITLCIETGSLPAVLQVGKKFDSIKYCLDTGHAHLDPKHSFKEYVDKLAERITYVHLTDNYGRIDDHEPPGVKDGMPHENWSYLLEELSKYENEIIGSFEMFPSMPGTMIKQSCHFLFDILGYPNRPTPLPGYNENSYQPF